MARAKKKVFSKRLQRLAEFGHLLGHPARIEILSHLATCEKCPASELFRLIPLSQPAVSIHLAALRQAGLVQLLEHGPRSVYSVRKHRVLRLFRELEIAILPEDSANPPPPSTASAGSR